MSWLSAGLPIVAAIALAILPGAGVGAALGLRRLSLWGFAPAFSFSVITIAAFVNQVVPFRWGVLPVLVVTAAVAAIAFLLSMAWRKNPAEQRVRLSRNAVVATVAGLAVAVVSIGLRLRFAIGAPDHIAQRFDNIFHLNAVRWILENDQASPFRMASLTFDIDGRTGFYPNLWHGFVALVADTTGASVPVAVNAASITIAAVIWPLASVLLVRQIAGPRPVALFAAGALSGIFTVFPYLMLDFGVLYPTLLALSLLPIALAGVLIAVGEGDSERLGGPVRWLALAGTLPGLALAHPTIVISLLAMTVPLGLAIVIRRLGRLRRQAAPLVRYLTPVVLALLWAAGLAVVFVVARPSTFALRPPIENLRQAAQGALTNGTVSLPADYLVSLLAVVGVVLCVRRRGTAWLAFAWLVSAGLYVVAASFPLGPLRTAITGFWYDDPYRLAAVLPVLVLPLAVMGILGLSDLFRDKLFAGEPATAVPSTSAGRRSAMLGTALVVLVGIGSQSGAALLVQTESAQEAYALTRKSALLTKNELALLERIDAKVPEGVTVAGNPSTGTSLVYALAGRRALLPHIFGDRDAATNTLIASLRDAADDPAVCQAAEDLNVSYALEFDGLDVDSIDRDRDFPGLEDLSDSDAMELVDRQGQASLYRLTACD